MLQEKSTGWHFPLEDGCFICVDKPKGPTSHQVDHWVRELTGVDKVGPVGTLDPQATGVLVMALGRAVKSIEIAHEQPKEYVAAMKLHAEASEEMIREVFNIFKGVIFQLPPIKSAVVRRLRSREIYDLEILEINGRDILFRVKCQSGTYVRTLCLDMGYIMGTRASMIDLRRVSSGPFKESQCITLQQLSDYIELAKQGKDKLLRSSVYSQQFIVSPYAKVIVKDSTRENIAHGSDLYPGGIRMFIGEPLKGERVGVFTQSGIFLGTGIMMVSFNQISDTKVIDFDRVVVDPRDSGQKKKKTEEAAPRPVTKFRPDRERNNPNRDRRYQERQDRNYAGRKNDNRGQRRR